ncbi:nucleoside diphosphate kinase [Nitzschia inconspicua]|uniref:Nucleoside diphosphate kinase n=1 Tax=Nitzschia inconspicua TaxID=303405 RepID=A0A9K3PN81_9STRA|nr:nucleoside diphosphate kinase [Nitzschia inconspicua]
MSFSSRYVFFPLLVQSFLLMLVLRPVNGDVEIPSNLPNSALIFIKPHANTQATQDLVIDKLNSANIRVLTQVDIGGKEIDEKGLIDQHYYSIASKATILPAKDIPVPPEKFQEAFGESWEQVLQEDRAVNAMEACKRFGCTPEQLNEAWNKVEAVKFGGGFYCAKVSVKKQQPTLYVFNAFFMAMRSKFVGPDKEIRCYVVEWDPDELSWAAFRQNILGPTDPADAPPQSIRRTILDQYQSLGLVGEPNKSDNGVHASASAFEGLAEKMNWLNLDPEFDQFGKLLLDSGLTKSRISEWAKDPQVKISDSNVGSVFDELEELDAPACIKKMLLLDRLNSLSSVGEEL